MARPQKNTVDYFPHDSDASDGKTITILFNNFGHEGISAWWQLLERVSATENHVIDTRNPEDMEYLSAKLHFSPERLIEILQKLADLGAIDSTLYRHGLIWSQNLVDRISDVYKKRKQDLPSKPQLPAPETELLTPETELLITETPQSKLNKSILKEKYGEFENVLLTKEEYEKLQLRFNSHLPEMIENLSAGIASKGYKYKSHYATILSWAKKEEKSKPVRANW